MDKNQSVYFVRTVTIIFHHHLEKSYENEWQLISIRITQTNRPNMTKWVESGQ